MKVQGQEPALPRLSAVTAIAGWLAWLIGAYGNLGRVEAAAVAVDDPGMPVFAGDISLARPHLVMALWRTRRLGFALPI